MKSIRTDQRNHAAEGDERIRTAARWLGAVLAYVRRCKRDLDAQNEGLPTCPGCGHEAHLRACAFWDDSATSLCPCRVVLR